MIDIAANLTHVNARIENARSLSPHGQQVSLLAVSKKQSADNIRQAFLAGQLAFGESYAQEALGKIDTLSEPDIRWHFIGPLQSNKCKLIAPHCDWIESVDRLTLAQKLNRYRPAGMPPLNICLQVNLFGEASKGGVALEPLTDLAAEVSALPRLRLRGLMAIPPRQAEPARQREQFARIRAAWLVLKQDFPNLDTLSMGMSGDFEAAILEGSTRVRLGTGIFGERD